MSRTPRRRKARGRSRVGERFEAVVGPVAHGGHCIVRVTTDPSVEPAETRVVFTRHAIPGERVLLEITEGTEGDRFWRGDAVEVLEPSPDRVPAPCRYAGPGRCGGCDFQHVSLPAQRELKAAVVREQLSRLAHLDVPVVVEPVAGDRDGLRWRTRVQYAEDEQGRRGMRLHRSRVVIPVDDCLIAREDAREPSPELVHESVLGRDFVVSGEGFWQVHPGAPRVLVETVLEQLDPRPGEKVLDLYAGVGLFAAFLAERVGERGRVVAVEGSRVACGHARTNLGEFGRAVAVEAGAVDKVLATAYDEPFDLVVLDPPREGARRPVVEQVVDRAPRAVAYVACDPAALARDVAYFAEHGYALKGLRAFDLFPMTHHVECVALLERPA
ncbi:class I SAM-dependent RNA methyltransferase [Nocardioides koreensis]|uniref:Class I SAM-dependent RNA methyltransferase n=1 Tax=Nocardioides koreensis TaxID=433651 RepID=A0ABP5LXI4_9ACTN